MIEICEKYNIIVTVGKTTYTESLVLRAGEPPKALKRVLQVAQELTTYAIKKSSFNKIKEFEKSLHDSKKAICIPQSTLEIMAE